MGYLTDLKLISTSFALCKRWDSNTWEIAENTNVGVFDYEMSLPIFNSINGCLVKDQFGYYVHLDRISNGYWNGSKVVGAELIEE